MTALKTHLKALQQAGKPLLIPYLMAGDGGLEKTGQLIDLYESESVSAIEIGIPFSDPVADGPVIQAAGLRSLEAGTTLLRVLNYLEARGPGKVPRIIMTYLNPVLRMGFQAFLESAVKSHVSALIIPDLPLEEMAPYSQLTTTAGIPLIPLIGPKTDGNRLKALEALTDGYVYAVTLSGTTGANQELPETLPKRLKELKEIADLPVIAGFGIHNLEQIASLKKDCDGVIIGSYFVALAHQNRFEEIRGFLRTAQRG